MTIRLKYGSLDVSLSGRTWTCPEMPGVAEMFDAHAGTLYWPTYEPDPELALALRMVEAYPRMEIISGRRSENQEVDNNVIY